MTKNEMIWDISQLVESTHSVSIQKKLGSTVAEAEKARDKCHGKIEGLDAKDLLELLKKTPISSGLSGAHVLSSDILRRFD